jgi:hypothetical protein
MEESTVTYIWMTGVIGVMIAYAAIAAVGLLRRRGKKAEK